MKVYTLIYATKIQRAWEKSCEKYHFMNFAQNGRNVSLKVKSVLGTCLGILFHFQSHKSLNNVKHWKQLFRIHDRGSTQENQYQPLSYLHHHRKDPSPCTERPSPLQWELGSGCVRHCSSHPRERSRGHQRWRDSLDTSEHPRYHPPHSGKCDLQNETHIFINLFW